MLGILCLLPSFAQAAYTDNADGTVTDMTTGLTWKHCGEGQTWAGGSCAGSLTPYTWTEANALTNSTYAGKSDWRVPTLEELQTLITPTIYQPTISSINSSVFPNQNYIFWSSTTDPAKNTNAMYVNFIYGMTSTFGKANSIAVHLVRDTATTTTTTSTTEDTDSTTSTTISITQSVPSGWNLLGNSLQQTIPVATLYDKPESVASVWTWDATGAQWQFYTPAKSAAELAAYTQGKGYGALSEIKPGDGYWVNALKTITLPPQTGAPFNLTAEGLSLGWNLVTTGDDISPSDLNYKLSTTPPGLDTGIPNNLTTLWAWDNSSLKWYFYAPSLEAQGDAVLNNYITSKGFLDFSVNKKTLGKGIGFWINKTGAPLVITSPTLTLSLTADDGITPVTSVSNTDPALVTATVLDADGKAVANAIVTFSVDPMYGAFAGGTNTALTDTNGIATAKLTTANTSGGAATVSASVMVKGQTVQGSLNYSIGSSVLTLSELTVPSAPLSAYGTGTISVDVLNNGEPYTTPIAVTFTSACAASGNATLTESVTTVNGTATASYLDNGCNNAAPGDTITATLLNGVTATAKLKVNSPTIGSLQFVSVETNPESTPPMITLKGTGGTNKSETAKVTFRVVDSAGHPLGNTLVHFTLNTTLGGLALTSSEASSDPTTGNVVTYVQAGTMSTTVLVTASTGQLSTQSGILYISTGIPAQDSISLSASFINIEGWNFDGETTDLTVHLADHFHNPVVDGTPVYFTSEGGAVAPGCTTVGNSCTAKLTSQALRPYNGRLTVLARTTGDEAFIDLNSNGKVDDAGEMIDANGAATDVGEAYLDYNEDGVRDTTAEPYIDFNSSGQYDGLTLGGGVGATTSGDDKYSGLLCTEGADICSEGTSIDVRASFVIIFSTSTADIVINDGQPINLPPCDPLAKTDGGSKSVSVTVVDHHGNAMPAGTKVSLETSNGGINAKDSKTYEYIVPNTNGCRSDYPGCPSMAGTPTFGEQTVTLISDSVFNTSTQECDATGSGVLSITVTTPNEVVTTSAEIVTD
jgi:hypothetical protein